MQPKPAGKKKPSQKVNQWKLNNFLERIDLFGADLPVFNLKGQKQVLTKTGGCLSLMVMIVWLTYGALKF